VHRIETEWNHRVAIVFATGELDAFAAPDLEAALAGVRGERLVVTDLAQVSFMDSTVLGIVARTARELEKAGTSVRIILPSTTARRIFEITALDRVLPVAESRAAAVSDLAGLG
jgi:anti-anti-sigma factor